MPNYSSSTNPPCISIYTECVDLRRQRGEIQMNQELEKQGAENTYRTPEEVLAAHERFKVEMLQMKGDH